MDPEDSNLHAAATGSDVRARVESFNDGELSYAGRDMEELSDDIIEKYGRQTTRLDLSFNIFRNLPFLDRFPRLEELVADNNEIDDSFELFPLPGLHTLSLNKNKITDLTRLLDMIEKFTPKLTFLSLLGNIACPNQLSSSEKDEEDYQRYRYLVIYRLPGLKFLDSTPIKDSERTEAKRVGPYTHVIRPDEQSLEQATAKDNTLAVHYTPLPHDSKSSQQHKGTFGKTRYVYYGKHSEGNRFIRNNDL